MIHLPEPYDQLHLYKGTIDLFTRRWWANLSKAEQVNLKSYEMNSRRLALAPRLQMLSRPKPKPKPKPENTFLVFRYTAPTKR
jgi:hypothetical protein